MAGYLQYYVVSSSPAAIVVMYPFAFLLTFSLRLVRNHCSHRVSKKLSLDLLSIENLSDYYDAYVAISQLCTLYPINDNELAVLLVLISKICEIYPNLSYRKAIKHYVDISLEKDKKNRRSGFSYSLDNNIFRKL